MDEMRSAMGRIEHSVDGPVTVRFMRTFHHPLERVWDALTRPDEVARWFTEMSAYSGRSGPGIPEQVDHRFRAKRARDSGGSGPGIPGKWAGHSGRCGPLVGRS